MKKFKERNLNVRKNNERETVAFIPVRGGSKGIPLKNIKLFCGKPLLYWTIKAACECEAITSVYVATNSELIKEIAEGFPFEKLCVIKRSEATATDTASTESAMLEFAEKYEFDDIVLIQATSPLIESFDLTAGLNKYIEGKYDSLLSVVRQKRFIWRENESLGIACNYEPVNRPRRQEMSGYLVENGAFYISGRKQLLQSKVRLSGKIGLHEMPEDTYFEIDEISDWNIAEELKWNRIMNGEKAYNPGNINLLVCDVDGVLTDAGMYYNADCDELKKFNTKDGKGFELLRNLGIKIMLLTSENTSIVQRRSEKLKVDFCFMGIKNKKEKLDEFLKINKGFSYDKMAYIGDDLNDLEVLKCVEFSAVPLDSVPEVKKIARYQCQKSGGEGCVREVCDIIRRFKNGK